MQIKDENTHRLNSSTSHHTDKSMEALRVKLYVVEGKAVKEVRRFSLEDNSWESFEYVDGKVRVLMPQLQEKELRFSWQGM